MQNTGFYLCIYYGTNSEYKHHCIALNNLDVMAGSTGHDDSREQPPLLEMGCKIQSQKSVAVLQHFLLFLPEFLQEKLQELRQVQYLVLQCIEECNWCMCSVVQELQKVEAIEPLL